MFSNKRGQSAIEYLMTYGWMLLVVAIVGGAIFAVVSNQNIESVSGFTGDDIGVDDFGLTVDNELALVLRNGASDRIVVDEMVVTDSNGEEIIWNGTRRVPVSGTETTSVVGIEGSSGANELDISITYSIGGLENLQTEGTIIGGLSINQSSIPNLYAAVRDGDKGNLKKLDGNGNIVWMYDEIGSDDRIYDVDSNGEYVVLADRTGSSVHKIDQNGDQVWEFTEPDADVRRVFFTQEGWIYAFDRDEMLYRIDEEGEMEWSREIENGVDSVATVDEENNFYAGTDVGFRQIDENGEEQIVYEDVGVAARSLEPDGSGNIYIGSTRFDLDGEQVGELHQVDKETGSQNWENDEIHGTSVQAIQSHSSGDIIVGDDDGYVRRISPDEEVKWEYIDSSFSDNARAITISDRDNVYIGDMSGNVFRLAMGSGEPIWRKEFSDNIGQGGLVVETGNFPLFQ